MTAAPATQPRNRRHMTWAEKGGCREKACRACGGKFKPPTSGHMYCSEECSRPRQLRANREAMRTYRKTHAHHVKRVKHAWDLRTKFGMSVADYDARLAAQGGRCLVCLEVPRGGRGVIRKLVVDHCHATGRIRGLLCPNCNTAIGLLREEPQRFNRAVSYLRGEL